ncbi:MAG: hypothetical protein L6265_06090 [Thermoplasmatales archaeon]|nr:hypothetical protein [Candidatus Thermoplasmatota archaeon]MCG2826144.1 hypothetical protein [Thermoplasmatales archaeon]
MVKNAIRLGIIFIIISSFVFNIVPLHSSALLENSLSLTFDKSIENVDVSPNANGTAIFSGVMEVSAEYIMEIRLSAKINGDGTENWVVSVDPSYIKVMGGTEYIPVTVSVKVPACTEHSVSGVIMLDVRGTPWGTGAVPINADQQLLVNINPFYRLSVSSPEPYQEITPHSRTTIDVRIENFGNTIVDDIEVTVGNKKQLEAAGWIILLPSSRTEVGSSGESVIVHVVVETPMDWTLWTDSPQEIVIKVSSSTAGISETYSTYIRQKGTYIPGFEPMITIIILSMIAIVLRKVKKC